MCPRGTMSTRDSLMNVAKRSFGYGNSMSSIRMVRIVVRVALESFRYQMFISRAVLKSSCLRKTNVDLFKLNVHIFVSFKTTVATVCIVRLESQGLRSLVWETLRAVCFELGPLGKIKLEKLTAFIVWYHWFTVYTDNPKCSDNLLYISHGIYTTCESMHGVSPTQFYNCFA